MLLALLAFAQWAARASAPQALAWLGPPQRVGPGLEYFTSRDRELVDDAGPIAAYLLRLDANRIRLASVHANDETLGLEPVDSIATRQQAIAAVNGSFFNPNGDPQFVLKEAGELVSDAAATRGAVIIQSPRRGRTVLEFDQIGARVSLTFNARGRTWVVPIDGVNKTRERGKLMLYTARYHPDTDTAPGGTEWVLSGKPARVTDVRRGAGRTAIPRDGSVLSFGGVDLPEALAALAPGARVSFRTAWTSLNGVPPRHMETADDIVSGAGLLRVKGRILDNRQTAEGLPTSYETTRHPRTMIGVDAGGFIWMVAVDGRAPDHSIGMTFADLERLCDRLRLTDALNLDGGGSTTMVIKGEVVNVPADGLGPRPVSDAILVSAR